MSMIINPYRFAAASGGPPTYVGGNANGFIDGGGGSLSLTSLTGGIGSAAQIGDIVILAVGYGVQSLRDGGIPGSYTSVANLSSDDSFDCRLKVGYKILTSADTSVSITGTGNVTDASGAAVHVWRNINATTPMDVTATTATGINAAQPDPPAITPVTAGAIIIVVGAAGGGTLALFSGPAMTGGLSYLEEGWGADTTDGHVAMYAKTNWSSGAFNPAAFSGGGGAGTSSWCACTLALRPA